MGSIEIRTSSRGWLANLAAAYRRKLPVHLIDDAETGVNPKTQTILDMGRAEGMSARDWVAILISLGVSGAGVWMIAIAFADPEPTTKFTLFILGGVVCVATGGHQAVRIASNRKPPRVKVSTDGFEISWDD